MTESSVDGYIPEYVYPLVAVAGALVQVGVVPAEGGTTVRRDLAQARSPVASIAPVATRYVLPKVNFSPSGENLNYKKHYS